MTDLSRNPAVPYVAPMFGFMLLTTFEGYLPKPSGATYSSWYPLAYSAKVAAVAVLVWMCRSTWRDLAPRASASGLLLAVVLGLAVTGVWVSLDGRYPDLPMMGKRTAFDPRVLTPATRAGFITVRLIGLVLLVPLMEELFWRSFLMRWVIDQDFTKVPVGRVTPLAAAVTSGCFALAHPEWLPALLTGLAWAWLVHHTKSLRACVISHAVANLALGVYVIATGHWKFW